MPWFGSWPSDALRRAEQALDDLEEVVVSLDPDTDDAVVNALSRFLVVRACGYLEQVFGLCLRAHFQAHAHQRVATYASAVLGRGSNPNPNYLIDTLRNIDPDWASELTEFLNTDSQRLRNDVKFLVAARNKIAHGESETIGRRRAQSLVRTTREVADWLIRRLDPR